MKNGKIGEEYGGRYRFIYGWKYIIRSSCISRCIIFEDRYNIRKHINNIFRSSEVNKNNNTHKMRIDGVMHEIQVGIKMTLMVWAIRLSGIFLYRT